MDTFSFYSRLNEVIQCAGGEVRASLYAQVTQNQIVRWCEGKSLIPLVTAGVLCAEAGISLDWLVFGNAFPREATRTTGDRA